MAFFMGASTALEVAAMQEGIRGGRLGKQGGLMHSRSLGQCLGALTVIWRREGWRFALGVQGGLLTCLARLTTSSTDIPDFAYASAAFSHYSRAAAICLKSSSDR